MDNNNEEPRPEQTTRDYDPDKLREFVAELGKVLDKKYGFAEKPVDTHTEG
jgi:hypothetical protein